MVLESMVVYAGVSTTGLGSALDISMHYSEFTARSDSYQTSDFSPAFQGAFHVMPINPIAVGIMFDFCVICMTMELPLLLLQVDVPYFVASCR